MTCDPLAYTGGGQLTLLLTLAIGCLFAGAVLLLIARPRGRAATLVLLVLVGGSALLITAGTPTRAAASDCPPAGNSLTIIQTSVIEGLAPGIEPVAITGIVSNNGADNTDITAIDVEIAGVVSDPGAEPGSCDPSDYVLLNPSMPVGRILGPGGSTAFGGASIGFSNKSSNQDTCKGATIQLRYTANPN